MNGGLEVGQIRCLGLVGNAAARSPRPHDLEQALDAALDSLLERSLTRQSNRSSTRSEKGGAVGKRDCFDAVGRNGIFFSQSSPGLAADCSTPVTIAEWNACQPKELRCDLAARDSPRISVDDRSDIPYFNPNQFREVVRVTAHSLVQINQTTNCSGTLISPNWVVTAAHCFLWEDQGAETHFLTSKDMPSTQPGQDIVLENDVTNSSVIAIRSTSPLDARETFPSDRLIIYGRYSGPPHYDFDLALLHLEYPIPVRLEIQPAKLATIGEFDPRVSMAGYGITNLAGLPQSGELTIAWQTLPATTRATDDAIDFGPVALSGTLGSFCSGDSGGPIFIGWHRGCASPGDEPRPRPIFAVTSNLQPADGQKAEKTKASECLTAVHHQATTVSASDAHQWICGRVGTEVAGCAAVGAQ